MGFSDKIFKYFALNLKSCFPLLANNGGLIKENEGINNYQYN